MTKEARSHAHFTTFVGSAQGVAGLTRQRVAHAAADGGLDDRSIARLARYHDAIPLWVQGPLRDFLTRASNVAATSTSPFRIRIASWPDGTWAALGFPRSSAGPRTEQLIRAYRTARRAGIFAPTSEAETSNRI
jgi:hypothetical protein